MAFQNNVFPIPAGFPGGFAGGAFYPSKSAINDATVNIPCTFGNFCWYVAGTEFNVCGGLADAPNTDIIAGLVIATNTSITYDAGVIFTDDVNTTIAPGANVEYAVRGQYFVNVIYVGAGAVTRGTPVWARNTDGAPAIGITTETGYTQTNFVTMEPNTLNVLNGLIRITNSEEVFA